TARERAAMFPGFSVTPPNPSATPGLPEDLRRVRVEPAADPDASPRKVADGMPTKAQMRGHLERIREPVYRAKRELDAATAHHERATGAWRRHAFLERARDWLARQVGDRRRFIHVAAELPKGIKSIAAEVERVRRDIADLAAQAQAMDSAPVPKEELIRRLIA